MPTMPCEWPVDYSSCATTTPAATPEDPNPVPVVDCFANAPAGEQAKFEQMAAAYLWNWTGRSFGLCEVTIKPCKEECWDGQSSFNGGGPFGSLNAGPFGRVGPWTPVIINGNWYNIGCGSCGDTCGCGEETLKIPGPIASVVGITEDGVVLDPSSYHVDNYRILVRTDGNSWPACGLEITYMQGFEVPVGGQIAAGILACEFYKAACRDATCSLPQRLQQITRQGVTAIVQENWNEMSEGKTGIWLVDSWIASIVKPKVMNSTVRSPDTASPKVRRTTWSSGSGSFYGGGY